MTETEHWILLAATVALWIQDRYRLVMAYERRLDNWVSWVDANLPSSNKRDHS